MKPWQLKNSKRGVPCQPDDSFTRGMYVARGLPNSRPATPFLQAYVASGATERCQQYPTRPQAKWHLCEVEVVVRNTYGRVGTKPPRLDNRMNGKALVKLRRAKKKALKAR